MNKKIIVIVIVGLAFALGALSTEAAKTITATTARADQVIFDIVRWKTPVYGDPDPETGEAPVIGYDAHITLQSRVIGPRFDENGNFIDSFTKLKHLSEYPAQAKSAAIDLCKWLVKDFNNAAIAVDSDGMEAL